MGIGETLRQALAKLVIRTSGYQEKTAFGNLQLCAGLEHGIEVATHAVGQRQLERVRWRRSEEESGSAEEEEGRENVEGILNNLTIEAAGTEEEEAKGLEAVLGVEVDGDGEGEVEGYEEGEGTLCALGALELLTQDAEPSRTTLVDAHNGFNELIRLEMLWTVRHCCPAGARFTFNCYRHWAQLLLSHTGELPVTILGR